MKNKLIRLLVGSIFALFTGTASAILIDLGTLNLDVTEGTFVNVVDVGGNSGMRWDSAPVVFEPIAVYQDDILNVGFEFLAGQSLELISGVYNSGREITQFRQTTSPFYSNWNSTTVSFTGVGGDLNSPGVFTSTSSGGFLNGTVAAHMTETSFSFHDIHFETEYFNLPDGPAVISALQLRITADDIVAYSGVPEPASFVLMIIGLAGLGLTCKRKRV